MKIIINHTNWWIFSMCIILINYLYNLGQGASTNTETLIVSAILTLVILTSYFFTKNSSSGLYVTPLGFTWKINGKDFHYPWDTSKFNVLISFNSFVLVELSNASNPKYRLMISWLIQKRGLEQIATYCPKNNILYKYLKKYQKLK